MVNCVRMVSEANRNFVVVKLDIKNAHNEMSRAAILESLEEEPTLRHLVWHVATVLAPHTGLETGGRCGGSRGRDRCRETQKLLHFSQLDSTRRCVHRMLHCKPQEAVHDLAMMMVMSVD